MNKETNMAIYSQMASTPKEAQKTIAAGRLKGFTDINPMYRIKTLTEVFGPAGIGWYTTVDEKWTDTNENSGETVVNVKISLYIKYEGEWSAPITGIGGSTLIANEKNGLRLSDEAYKMAYTDAISIACKALGMCHDIYFAKDRTKYDLSDTNDSARPSAPVASRTTTANTADDGMSDQERISACKTVLELTELYNSPRYGGNKSASKEVKHMVAAKLKELQGK